MSGGSAARRSWQPFVGRVRELDTLRAALDRHPLVAVTGPAGVGKTRLVAEAIERSRIDWTTVDLAGLPSSAIEETVAGAIEQEASQGLVLDHADDALAALASLVPGLDRPLVVVSQVAPHLPGERRVLVAPPGADDAAGLFLAAAERTGVRPDDLDAEAVRRICARVDHLPLALELAAAQLRHRSITELEAALEDPLTVLVAPDRTAGRRSLEDTVAGGLARLAPAERGALEAVSWFDGPFTRADAAAMSVGDQALEALVDHSLLLVDTTPEAARFRLLATTRAHVARHRDAGDHVRHRDRFVAWAIAVTEGAPLRGPHEHEHLVRLDGVARSLRAALGAAPPGPALELALRLAPYAERRDHLAEGRRHLERLAVRPDLPDDRRADAWVAAGGLALRQSDLDGAEAAFSAAEQLGTGDGAVARATVGLGRVARRRGNYELADALLGRGLKGLRTHGEPADVAATLAELGRMAGLRGRRDDAADFLDEAITIARGTGDRRIIIEATTTLAKAAEAAGDHAGAETRLRQALREARALGDDRQIADLLTNLADAVYLREGGSGRYLEAEELHFEALTLAERLGDGRRQASSLSALGMISYRRTDFGVARDRWRRSVDLSLDVSDRRTAIATQGLLANLEAMDGDPARGWHLISDAVTGQRELGEPRALMFTLIAAVEIARDAERWPEARALAEEAEALATTLGDRRTRATAGLHLASVDVLAGETDAGLRRALAASALALAEEERHVTARCLELVATALAGDPATVASAAFLFGAGEMLRGSAPHTAYIRPGFRGRYVSAVERCGQVLGPALDHHWMAGHASSPTGAVDHARAVITSPAAPALPPTRNVARTGTFHRAAGGWVVGLDGATTLVPDAKGMSYLATLLAQPHHAVAATDLAGAKVAQPGVPVADATALRDYRRRLRQAGADERSSLEQQLAGAVTRAGTVRSTGASAERARKAVTKCLRDTITRLADADTALGDHLRRSIRTGTCCSYEPEGHVVWR